MKISSWNVNSVRARIQNIVSYIKKSKPDVLMIQEIKTENKNFPVCDFSDLGYESHIFGQKSYNGVALITKKKITNINIKLLNENKFFIFDILKFNALFIILKLLSNFFTISFSCLTINS